VLCEDDREGGGVGDKDDDDVIKVKVMDDIFSLIIV